MLPAQRIEGNNAILGGKISSNTNVKSFTEIKQEIPATNGLRKTAITSGFPPIYFFMKIKFIITITGYAMFVAKGAP